MGITDEQYKEAARKAYAAGDVKTARSLLARVQSGGQAYDAQGFPTAPQGGSTTNSAAVDELRPRLRAAMAGAADAASFYGSDEALGLAGGISSLAQGNGYMSGYEKTRDDVRAGLAEAQAGSPTAYAGGEILGSIIPALTGVGAVESAGSTGGRIIAGGLSGGLIGGGSGFMAGEDGLSNRLKSGAIGTLIGGGLGLAIPAAAAGGRHMYRAAQGARQAAKVGGQIGAEIGVSPSAGRVVGALVGDGNEAEMRAFIAKAGKNGMLADAGPNTAGMLDATMRNPLPGAQLARSRVDARAGQSYDGVIDALTGGKQGPRMPPVANQAAKSAAARPTINPLYKSAYDTPIDYSAPEGLAIDDLLGRIPPKQATAAIEKATDQMIYDGFPNMQIMASIGDDGKVAFTQKPNVMQLDYMKRAFDDVAEASKDAVTGRMTPDGAFAAKVARDIREATKDAVPQYGEALAAASTDIRSRAAVRTGQTLLRSQTTVEDVMSSVADATPAELRHMREGVMGQIDHVMGNVKAVGTDQNIDARQAQKLFADLSSPNSKQKLSALFGDEYPTIMQKLDEAGSALGLRANIAGNSSTQPRQAAIEMIQDEIAPGAVRRLEPIGAPRELAKRALGSDQASIDRLGREVQAELADVLTRPNGDEVLSSVVRILAANPQRADVGDGLRKALTAGGFTGLPGFAAQLQRQLGTLPER
jgi:hypothetical protein